MARTRRYPKTLLGKLRDLDDHLYLLREQLARTHQDPAHLKVLSAELRVLACKSSGTEGLLWRTADELHVPDSVFLHVGEFNQNHPMAQGLVLGFVTLFRGGLGPKEIPPDNFPLRDIIKQSSAVCILGKHYTFEYVIKAFAQQIGSAHEDDGVEPVLVMLRNLPILNAELCTPILTTVSELVLEVGERVLCEAEETLEFARMQRSPGYGDVSIALRMGLRQALGGRLSLFRFVSFVSSVEISCFVSPTNLAIEVLRKGEKTADLCLRYPDAWQYNHDAVFVFCYCSSDRRMHGIVNGSPQDEGIPCDLGWVHGNELKLVEIQTDYQDFVYKQFLASYAHLLSPEDTLMLLEVSADDLPRTPFVANPAFPGDSLRRNLPKP